MSFFGFFKDKPAPKKRKRHVRLASAAAAAVVAAGAHSAPPPQHHKAQPSRPLASHQTGLERFLAKQAMHVRLGYSHEQAAQAAFDDMIDQLTMVARKEKVLFAAVRLLAGWLYK